MKEKIIDFVMVVSGFEGEKEELLGTLTSNLELDSLEKVSYVVMLEEEYNIFISDEDIEEIDYEHTVQELVESTIILLKRKVEE